MKFFILILLTAFRTSTSTFQPSYNDEICQSQLNSLSIALSKREDWAIELFDSWAKIQAGYLSGNVFNYGNYDQCMSFKYDTPSSGTIEGRYCIVDFKALPNSTLRGANEDFDWREFANFIRKSNLKLSNGFCLPASCGPRKVIDYLNREFFIKNDLVALGAQCNDDSHLRLETIDIVAIVTFSLVFLAIIVETIYDFYKRSHNQEPNKFLISFSIYTNGIKLFDMTKSKSPSFINCLNGLRVISTLWIILGHRVNGQVMWKNPYDLNDFMIAPQSTLLRSLGLAVDTFFVIGSVLMTCSVLRDCEKNQLNIARTIWRRYLRYIPTLGALILFVASISKYFANGPCQSPLHSMRNTCTNYWWAALLNIQNYFHDSNFCIGPSWYLSADFQLFLVSPIIVYLMYKCGKRILALPAVLLGVSIIYIIAISASLGISMPQYSLNEPIYSRWIYYQTLPRAGPWSQGMMLGYFLYTKRGQKCKIHPLLNAFLWTLTFAIQITIIMLSANLPFHRFSRTFNVTFIVLYHNLWGLSICWIIFACHHLKTGGIVRWFLSLPHWQPINRLGLGMYLTHEIYQIISRANQRVPLFMSFWHFFPICAGDITASTILAMITYLAFEAPVVLIEEYVYKELKKNKI